MRTTGSHHEMDKGERGRRSCRRARLECYHGRKALSPARYGKKADNHRRVLAPCPSVSRDRAAYSLVVGCWMFLGKALSEGCLAGKRAHSHPCWVKASANSSSEDTVVGARRSLTWICLENRMVATGVDSGGHQTAPGDEATPSAR